MKIECTPEEFLQLIKKEPQNVTIKTPKIDYEKFIQNLQKNFSKSLDVKERAKI